MEHIVDINRIPVGIMRKALEDSGLPMTRASQALGWGKDAARLRRTIGLAPYNGVMRTHVDYPVAVEMVRAWRLDPVDYGV